jgi:ferrous iron transport protein B
LQELQDALGSARPAATTTPNSRAGWRIEPHRAWFDHAAIAGLLLLLPAVLAVTFANLFAGLIEPMAEAVISPLAARAAALPTLLAAVLAGDYGLLTMGPLLLVWAAPPVLLFAVLLGTYKATGMLDRITTSLHPHLRRFGLTGRDLARVVMGAGCNVPAVLATRSSPSCSRGTCMSTISFGAACSYQFGATLAVFAAAGMWLLIFPYLLALAAATLGYAAWVSRFGRGMGALVTPGRVFLEAPSAGAVWREARATIRGFFVTAVPVFLVIAAVASLLHLWGVLEWAATVINPAMALFGLPSAAALPVVLASIRKDGILLFDSSAVLDVITPGQLLVGVFLAGVLLPCIVTAWTVWRESSGRFVAKMMARQAVAALVATFVLAWIVFGLERLL